MNLSHSLLGLVFLIGAAAAQDFKACDSKLTFVDRNMVDYVITVRSLRGSIADTTGVPVPKDCVALFATDRSSLLRTIEGNDKGEFAIRGLKTGDYWLVVQDPQRAFCPATTHVRLRTFARKSKIAVHMEGGAIDHCSYCESR